MRRLLALLLLGLSACDWIRDQVDTANQSQNVYIFAPTDVPTEPGPDGAIGSVVVSAFGPETGPAPPAEGAALRVGNTVMACRSSLVPLD